MQPEKIKKEEVEKMRIGRRYNIEVVVKRVGDCNSNCYSSYDELIGEYPDAEFEFGFRVFDTVKGEVPESCSDFCTTVQDALHEYLLGGAAQNMKMDTR